MSKTDPFDFAATWMAYRKGQLSEKASRAFEAQLEADPSLKALHKTLLDRDTSNRALRFLSLLDVEAAYRRCMRPVVRRQRLPWWASAAVVLLLLGGALTYLNRPVPERHIFTEVDSSRWDEAPRITLADGHTILLDTLTVLKTSTDLHLDNHDGLLNVATAHKGGTGKQPENIRWHRLDIPFAQRYNLRLPDGTQVTLNAGATLEFPGRFDGPTRNVRLSGEAYFDVAPDDALPFVVSLNGLKVTALGTAFNIQAYDNEDLLQTTLVHGKVAIEDTTGTVRILLPGQQAAYSRQSGEVAIRTVDPAFSTAWMDNYFYFQETPLETIMQQVGHWYGMDVLYIDAKNKQTRYTGKIQRYPTIEPVLNKFKLAGNLDFDIEDRCIRIKRK